MNREDTVKQWMTIGLQDDKWVEFLPNSPKWHPWFLEDGTINVELMATDAMEAFSAPEQALPLVTKWATEVKAAFEQQKEQQKS